MTLAKKSAVGAIVSMAFLVAGCYEDPTVQMHEPGEYQGATDPLLKIAGTPDQNERLASRFLAVQTDR